MRAPVRTLVLMLLAITSPALITAQLQASSSGEMKPLRMAARPGSITALYRAQLLPDLDVPIRDAINLHGKSIPARISEKGDLELDLKGDGKHRRYTSNASITIPIKLEGSTRSMSIKLMVAKKDDKTWTYRNANQLNAQIGQDQLIIVDANANGIYNEAGIDGMTLRGYDYVFPLPTASEVWCTPNYELTGFSIAPYGDDAKVQGHPLTTTVSAALPVLKGIIDERLKLGLTPRPEDKKLSEELQKHCKYMNLNKKLTHPEDKGKPGYTPEGHKAGMRSILAWNTPGPNVAKMMVGTYFHRQDVIRPGTTSFGVGMEGPYSGIDGRSNDNRGSVKQWPILCPAPGQSGVGTRYNKEAPDATPGDSSAGYPITAYFNARKITLTKYYLKAIGPAAANTSRRLTRRPTRNTTNAPNIDCYPFDHKQGASARMTGFQKCICIIPKEPLQGNTTYEVTLEADVNGQPWSKTWQFSTGASALNRRR